MEMEKKLLQVCKIHKISKTSSRLGNIASRYRVSIWHNFDYLAGSSNGTAEKVEGPDKNGRLYDKAGKVRKIRHENKEADGEG